MLCAGVIGCLTAHGVGVGGALFCEWAFQKDIKDPIREDSVVVIYVSKRTQVSDGEQILR
jgi:hypothetical protein